MVAAKKCETLHDFACHPSKGRGHANLLCIVPILKYLCPVETGQGMLIK